MTCRRAQGEIVEEVNNLDFMPVKTKVIVNPIAGGGSGGRRAKQLLAALKEIGIAPIVHYTSQPDEARHLARGSQDADLVICIGGDGTINEVINGLLEKVSDQLKPLAILPIGAGNVIAKELKLSRNIPKLMQLLRAQKTVRLDVGCLSFPGSTTPSRKFISMAGSGFDAEVARRYHLGRKGASLFHPHLFSYLPLSLRVMTRYDMPRISVEIDGVLYTQEASFVQVANAHSYGGPFTFVPQARPDDGWLDILWYTGRASRDMLRYYWSAFKGNGLNCNDAHYVHGKKIVLASNDPVPIQVDGDCCGYLPVEIEVIPEVISILVS